MTNQKQAKAAQDFVPIKEIRDGAVILKNNELRLVLMASSLNFALKSPDEQNAIIAAYQNFINSLDFPIQIFIESRRIDINPYLMLLDEREKNQTNELLQLQTKEYIEFVKNLVATTNIVSKTFYIVIPYAPSFKIATKEGVSGIFKGFFKTGAKEKTTEETGLEKFAENKLQLQQRADTVIQGLAGIGVRLAPLNTEELIELYYGLFNPGELEKSAPQTLMANT